MKKLEGRKTYIAIAVLVLGMFGIGDIITETDMSVLIDSVMQIIGVIGAIYGRYDATRRMRTSVK